MPSSALKIGGLALAILVGVGVLLYVSNLHHLEQLEPLEPVEPEYSTTPPLPEEGATQEVSTPAKSYPRTVYINGVELEFSEYHEKYFSQSLSISEVAAVQVVFDPEAEELEFWVDVDHSKLYEAVKRLWNESAVIYAEPSPPFASQMLIEGPLPVNDVYRHLWELQDRLELANWRDAQLVTLREIVESAGKAIGVNISRYAPALSSEDQFAPITFEAYGVGYYTVRVDGAERSVWVRVRFAIPRALVAHWMLGIRSSSILRVVEMVWFRDPYFYEVVAPAFRFIADFLELDYVARAQLIKEFFRLLRSSSVHATNFGDVLVGGGVCREFGFYSALLARELGVDRVYMLVAVPKVDPGRWIILSPEEVGHMMSVTDDPLIGDTRYSISVGGRTLYLFVDNGWAISNWEEFLSMLRDGEAFLLYFNPQYSGRLSLTDIRFSMYLRSLAGELVGAIPYLLGVVRDGYAILVYDVDKDRAFMEPPKSVEDDRFDPTIPLTNVTSWYTWMFWEEVESALRAGGKVEIINETNTYELIAKWYESCFDIIEISTEEGVKKVAIPKPQCLAASYEKRVYPNGVYEEVVVYGDGARGLYRIVASIPIIIERLEQAEKISAAASMGEPVEVGGYRVTVLELKEARYLKGVLGTYHQVPSGTKGVLVALMIEVTGQKVWCPERYTTWGYLITEPGNKYGFTTTSRVPLILGASDDIKKEAVLFLDLTMSACVGPGKSTGGHLLFVIPEDERPAKLVLYIGPAEIVVNLQE
jgi:hypothetical protein